MSAAVVVPAGFSVLERPSAMLGLSGEFSPAVASPTVVRRVSLPAPAARRATIGGGRRLSAGIYSPAMPMRMCSGAMTPGLPAQLPRPHPSAGSAALPVEYGDSLLSEPVTTVQRFTSVPVAGAAIGSYAPAPQVVQGVASGSYSAPVPALYTAPHPPPAAGPPAEPLPPPSLTSGIPDPLSIERQKSAYSKGLDDQLKHGTDVLAQQLKQQSDYLYAVGDQQKRQYNLQVDQQIKQQEMLLAQQHNEQLLMLQQAAQQQKSALEHQANALLLEYNQRKAHEELLLQQYQFQRQHYETQLKYNDEMQDLQAQQQAAARQVAQQHTALASQAASAQTQAQVARQTSVAALRSSAVNAVANASTYVASAASYAAPVPRAPTTAWAPAEGGTYACRPPATLYQSPSVAVLQTGPSIVVTGPPLPPPPPPPP
mmetsp:Transcript_85064/g.183398  ORF Transcript_85064/g.183398 Transcript_85064/m.183398 type:complete len:428 (-) Transcript_85064:5-1288(-)